MLTLADRLIFSRQAKAIALVRLAILVPLLGICVYLMIRNFFWVGAVGLALFLSSEGIALYAQRKVKAFEEAEKEDAQEEYPLKDTGDAWFDRLVDYPTEEKQGIW